MNTRPIKPLEERRRQRVRRAAKELIHYVSLSRIARVARVNRSTLHRFIYQDMKTTLFTTNRLLEAVLVLERERVEKKLPKRSEEVVFKKKGAA